MTVPDPSSRAAFDSMGDERFVALTTYRKSGVGVATAVWIARGENALLVTTPAASGKVKRLRNNAKVQLQPCSRSGKVAVGARTVDATAEILGSAEGHPAEVAAIRRKYGLEYRLIVAVEAVTRRVRRQTAERLILRITFPAA